MPAPPPSLPPLPPSRDGASFSEMLPFRSTKIRLWKSPFLVLGLVTAVVVTILFANIDAIYGNTPNDQKINAVVSEINTIVAYILFLIGWVIHIYTRSTRSVLFYVFPALCCWLMLEPAPFTLLEAVFRKTLPGDVFALPPNAGFVSAFVANFFGAGLMEELLKASGILVVAAMTLYGRTHLSSLPPGIAGLLSLRGPLDGVLMGIAAGAMFVFVETAGFYGIGKFAEIMQNNNNDVFLSWGVTLSLILPRTFGGITGPGHISYSAVFGYFIGLAMIRPSSAPKLILGGWLAAAILHTTWNALPSAQLPQAAQYVWGGVTVAFFLACLLKARQIDAVLRGGAVDTGGSIVVDAAPAAAAGRRPASPLSPSLPDAPRPLSLVVAGQRIALLADAHLDLGALPALAGRGAGLKADVARHPSNPDVIGLRNSGDGAWKATLTDGRTQEVSQGRNVRLSPGVRIDFGGGIVGLVAAV